MRITAQNLIDIKPQLADLLSSLEVGDTVRGKIMELLGESITIRTASGQLLTAALMTDAELKQGQTIELVISDINEAGVFAELKGSTQKPAKITQDVKLQQVLEQMDIKPDKSNIQAAKLLVKYNMPITKENILQLMSTQKSVETMAKPDIIKALSLIQSEQDINNTEFTKLVKQAVILEPQGEQALKLLQQDMPDIPIEKYMEPQKAAINNVKTNAKENIAQAKEATVNTDTSVKQIDKQQMTEKKPQQVLLQALELLDTDEMQQSAQKVEKLIDTIVKVFETAAKAQPEHSAYLISKEMEVTPAAIKALTSNVESQGKLGTQVKELEHIIEVLEHNNVDIKELKQDVKKLFLKPEALQDKERIQETIKEIIKTAGKLESLLRSHGLEDKLDTTVFSDIKGNLDFQQNINTNLNYIQIPILINENKTSADIYLLSSKKKGKPINPENASILIALDLVGLGHIESLINVTKKVVNVTFKVEKDQFKQLILGSGHGLKQALEARGYSLNSIQVIDITERFNLLELEEMTAVNFNKMHVDVKV